MEPDARKLSQELLQAAGSRQEQLLARLRDNKGVAYTDALAAAIPQLKGAVRNKAREALAERLSRMTASTLRDKLADEDAEIRRAAALACTVKGDKDFVPDLIRLLDDSVPAVARAALAALKELSGQDLGASGDKWKAWWKKK
jgi:HEAT repeat protein